MLVLKLSHRWSWGRRSSGMWPCSSWRRGHQPVSKRRSPVTQWRSATTQSKWVLKLWNNVFQTAAQQFLRSGYLPASPHSTLENHYCHFFFSWHDSPLVDLGLLIHEACFSRSHTTTHHSRWDSSGWMISSPQRPLPDNTQQTHTAETCSCFAHR